MDFIDWILDLEEYFNYWEICDEEKVQHVSNKLDREKPNGWWDNIQINSKRQGRNKICSW